MCVSVKIVFRRLLKPKIISALGSRVAIKFERGWLSFTEYTGVLIAGLTDEVFRNKSAAVDEISSDVEDASIANKSFRMQNLLSGLAMITDNAVLVFVFLGKKNIGEISGRYMYLFTGCMSANRLPRTISLFRSAFPVVTDMYSRSINAVITLWALVNIHLSLEGGLVLNRLFGRGRALIGQLINIRSFKDGTGSLNVVESGEDLPFEIHRIYYIYGVEQFASRGAHAHRNLRQLIIAISGKFTVDLTDGVNSESHTLQSPDVGLLLPPGLWRDLHSFTSDGICLVLASHHFDEADYIREYPAFLNWTLTV